MTKIFLTGITGLVGSSFAVSLLRDRKDVRLVVLTRKNNVKSAGQRVESVIMEQCEFDGCPDAAGDILKRIDVIEGDVIDLDPAAIAPRLAEIKTVFHCAADVNLGKDADGRTYRINFNGTQNVLTLAKMIGAREFHYVSTAYVAGKREGRALEDCLEDAGFNNSYEKSKFHAEQLIRQSGIPFTIYRPSIIIGRISDGKVRKALAFYRVLEFMAKMKSHLCAKHNIDPTKELDMEFRFETYPSEIIYFSPIDFVQRAIAEIFKLPASNRTYHLTGDSPVSCMAIGKAIADVLKFKNIEIFEHIEHKTPDEKLLNRFLGDLLPYFSSKIIFDQTNIRNVLGEDNIKWEVGEHGLHNLMRGYYRHFFSNVEWLQRVIGN